MRAQECTLVAFTLSLNLESLICVTQVTICTVFFFFLLAPFVLTSIFSFGHWDSTRHFENPCKAFKPQGSIHYVNHLPTYLLARGHLV